MWQDVWADKGLAAGCDCYLALASLNPCQAAFKQSQAGNLYNAGFGHTQDLSGWSQLSAAAGCPCLAEVMLCPSPVRLLASRTVCRWA